MSDSQQETTDRHVGIPNAIVTAEFLLGGAPSPDNLKQAVELGYGAFIDLRSGSEDGVEETRATLKELGVPYTHIPVAGAAGLTRENVAALDAALDVEHSGPVAVFCATGNRVGALMALRAHWHLGASPEEAIEVGKAHGMTRLEAKVSETIGG